MIIFWPRWRPDLLVLSSGPARTEELAGQLAQLLQPGDVITLEAPLGGGKTTFVRGLAAGLGVPEDEVSSPTFVIWQIYEGRLRLHHLDAYRLRSAEELEEIGLSEALGGQDVMVLEWPGVAEPLLPADRLQVRIEYGTGEEERTLELEGRGNWRPRLEQWKP
ncbi:MAG: tRNA (adenosine(37)-N6)-threonylcarbamoyltransferase complex ATPase subunit type 1 TsaE [Candidatus Eremiobacteraeota bacterium]|nr:tRNA (adenosine(37)-N6)-threonylcarbamoyltransferase complex ATPase subunit type 1 TsaE [Candidatus Eremiobacteraeota bacterium]MCW5870241.1 tRNA (adenosine(37)-N6)-threonylcarbamoyltransferase complex ATPase subunit type 1 TsaE [Candidatus Eremiobacteraeota bacterium]